LFALKVQLLDSNFFGLKIRQLVQILIIFAFQKIRQRLSLSI